MIRFIWKNWWRHKERFLLLLIGALIVSSGLSYLVGLSQSNKGTVVDSLQKRWNASYHIVVRPPDSRSVTEEKGLLEPNYLSGLTGGITLEQYETIKDVTNVDVAAPISMIGYTMYIVDHKTIQHTYDGIYKKTFTITTDTGPKVQKRKSHYFYPIGGGIDIKTVGIEIQKKLGLLPGGGKLSAGVNVLLAAIDPEAEARLVGLDEAVIDLGDSRYFRENDESSSITGSGETPWKTTRLPILMTNKEYVDKTYEYEIARLDLPFDFDTAQETLDKIKENGGEDFLETIPTVEKNVYSINSQELYEQFIESITGIDLTSKEPLTEISEVESTLLLREKPSPLTYNTVTSPFFDRWPYAYEVEPYIVKSDGEDALRDETYRPIKLFSQDFAKLPRITPYWIGFFDPGKLNISLDPLTELPMETYRPASANLVLDAEEQPVNPPVKLKPVDESFSFLTKSPSMLTTIDAAAEILGDKPISAIRIKVEGVTDVSEQSQAVLEKAANEIETKTGLITDITLGSSPQPTLTHIPAVNGEEELGWFEQPWVKIGSTFTIFNETKVGFSGVIASVIGVAVVYVFASNIVSLLARRKEFAVLLAVGWRPSQLSKMIVVEALLLGSFTALIAWLMLGLVHVAQGTDTSMLRVLLIGLFGLSIYGLGSIIPAFLARRIAPYETMRTGEITRSSHRLWRTKGVISLAVSYLLGKMKRSSLSIIAIALPTSLLSFFIFITFRLQGVMYTTWLGQYVSLEVGPSHYLAMGVSLLIAILTTAEIMWQNVSERSSEIALLKAIGWQDESIRWLILLEGIFSGIIAGVLGLSISLSIVWGMYQEFPLEHLGFMLVTGVVPIIAGILGAILPTARAVRVSPSQGVGGQYSNKQKIEKRLKVAMAAVMIIFLAGVITIMLTLVPNTTGSTNTPSTPDKEIVPATGEMDSLKEE
ncbi:ABC transporter permease [Virgibacillus oceani]|uniref:ABC3 transporter permease C-terminal domain-containing protein n=1 Tax=Virgibacillus oceani TaxID=1479511 RepID=A0A917H3U8_9BACI|nr:FtsX-like permease family protein [Virgibacillus oceani]GGG66599.1 hypothetical protein GCM10011398_07820 [Virgibacillus oceani]